MVDEAVEWDIDANLPMYTRDYLKLKNPERSASRLKIVLARNDRVALQFCVDNQLRSKDVVIVRGVQSIEGLRFRYEDVIRVPGWSLRSDIEEIEDRILRTHIFMSPG